jgi:hypothetical protein
MTTINASIFDGLTGANPTLIARATELINDPRLTSLEPLRQALNDGTWTIRVATAADQLVKSCLGRKTSQERTTRAFSSSLTT